MDKRQLATVSATIKELEVGAFVTLNSRLERGGALQARKLASGATQFYWRFSYQGKTSREPIGAYDPHAPPKKLEPTNRGYGVAAALEKCRELAIVHAGRSRTGGLHAAKAEQQQAFEVQKALEVEKSEMTLQKLMDTYVDYLKSQGRRSFVDAGLIFRKHVTEARPRLARAPATDVTSEQVLDLLRTLIEANKGRTSNKLRAYLRAAYQCALDVNTMASIPVAFKRFRAAFNPVAQTRRSPKFDRADKRPLNRPGFHGGPLA